MEKKETATSASETRLIDLYLNLLEQTLTGVILQDPGHVPRFEMKQAPDYDETRRLNGRDFPVHAPTMIGQKRLRHLRGLVESVLANRVPGDFIETGVWRGGACIFMRAILAAYGVTDRRVWLADSFAGLPPPNPKEFAADEGGRLHTNDFLAVSLDEVKSNFMKYNMLDDQVRFLKGWFKDTLPAAPIEALAILRLDGDMYESTVQALDALYDKLSVNGFVVVDDYFYPPCKKAVHDFLAKKNIDARLIDIDGVGSYWQKLV